MTIALMEIAMMTGVAVVVVKMTVVMSKALKVFKEGGLLRCSRKEGVTDGDSCLCNCTFLDRGEKWKS